MKKIFALIFMATLCMAPAQAQILKSLGEKALNAAVQGAAQGAGNAVKKQVTKRVEKKAEGVVNKALNDAFGEVKADTLEASTLENMSGLGQSLGAATAAYGNAISSINTAANAQPLRDFSEQNAARAEHNKTLKFDDWD